MEIFTKSTDKELRITNFLYKMGEKLTHKPELDLHSSHMKKESKV